MRRFHFTLLLVFLVTGFYGCNANDPAPAAPQASVQDDTIVTLLFTNDVESAYDPIPAFWLDDISMIGGIAEMTTLIETLRASEPNVFLFDSGDIFTGALAADDHDGL
jgi:2',3'-cyclic-nucleotide 2'-phosphodiesterase (5'-nucleotidase family)